MAKNDDPLERIDSKLTALLALVLDGYLRETGVARPKQRTIDRMLVDAGLSPKTVADLLGKTDTSSRPPRVRLRRLSAAVEMAETDTANNR